MITTTQTANELLDAMRGCGFTLNLDGDMLEVNQARWIDDELAGLIKTHKAGLIKILENEAIIFTR
ncbi:hypothetical protein [Methylotenera sp.]|uniref:hypothetical protein n=1 Tax=Methylotenera sp. TaxID=2051956 RepID=UPI00248A29F9|nr:hypothetical protein [Methylotenera sp.]MDI1360860.1 hypothetical protein [Methylotenera sp.]